MREIGVFLGLVMCNLVYQLFTERNYSRAIDLSFYQGVAIFCVVATYYWTSGDCDDESN